MNRRLGFVAAVILVGTALLATAAPAPEELLRQVEEVYAGLRSFEAVGELTFEFRLFTSRSSFQIWASYPRFRSETEPVDPAPDTDLMFISMVVDHAAGRQWTSVGRGPWWEEEVALDWLDLAMFGVDVVGSVFTSAEGEELAGRPMWVLTGTAQRYGQEVLTRVWVDQESLWVRKTRVESPGVTMIYEVREFRPGVEISEDVFLLPPGATVIVRPPASPEAEAIMERAWDRYEGLTSFIALQTEHTNGMESETTVWYQEPILRMESTSRVRHPLTGEMTRVGPVSVSVYDLERGVMYSLRDGRWRGTETFQVTPELRISIALSIGLGLRLDARFTAVEEDAVGDRPAWRITGEPAALFDELHALRWWVDRETYEVFQYEQPLPVPVGVGVRRTKTRTVRVERFEPDAEVPAEKLRVPEGVPIRRFEEQRLEGRRPAAVEPPGERAEKGVAWEPFSEERLAEARARGKPVLLYFTAAWCLACRDFEDGALHDKRVVEATEPFVRLVVDLTDLRSPEAVRLQSLFRVDELPLTLILRADGTEVRRITGSVPASVLLAALLAVGQAR